MGPLLRQYLLRECVGAARQVRGLVRVPDDRRSGLRSSPQGCTSLAMRPSRTSCHARSRAAALAVAGDGEPDRGGGVVRRVPRTSRHVGSGNGVPGRPSSGRLQRSVAADAVYWPRPQGETGGLLYAALDDSAAQDIGASSPGNGYISLVAERLRDAADGPVEVVNVSKSGARIGDVLDTLERDAARIPPIPCARCGDSGRPSTATSSRASRVRRASRRGP